MSEAAPPRAWEHYMCRVEGEPASIFVDLALASRTPLRHLGQLAHIRLHMRQPRPDGLSSQEEFDALCGVEDALEAALPGPDQALYVGRCTAAGCRDFFYYVTDLSQWKQAVRSALGSWPQYRFEVGGRDDPEWQVYREFLRPSPAEMERIKNRYVCRALQERGDRLTEPREVRHWAHFPTAAARSAFVERAAADGFQALHNQDEPEQERHLALLSRLDVPSQPAIDDVTLLLRYLAEQQGGGYDGWETVVMPP